MSRPSSNLTHQTKIDMLSLIVSLFLVSCSSLVYGQQPYVGSATNACETTDNSTSLFWYFYNGLNESCQSYLTFRSQPPYNTVSSISDLLAADPSRLSQLNSVPESTAFETNKVVLIPVSCSRSGAYYQANVSYIVRNGDTYLGIANNTFQGLSTCQALQAQNGIPATALSVGTAITVPVRCACPTRSQTDMGERYLLSYVITWGEIVYSISEMFGVDTGRTLEANGLSEQNSNINPFTTLLVPLPNPPSSSQTIAPPPPPPLPPPPQPPSSSNGSSSRTWLYVFVGVLGGVAVALATGATVFCMFFRKRKKRTDPIISSESFEACEKPGEKKLEEESLDFLESISSIAQSLKVYTFEEIQSATDNFSPNCWIRGSVYRGKINGDFAAIKKMNGDVSKEIGLLNKINHFNLIRLSGVCFNDGNWYLIYEYANNGPLSDWIYYSKSDQKFLSWTQRIQIALDVATGLNYLHSYTFPSYVHKDVKSGNVLLDSDFRAKIANFGLAKSADVQEGEFVLTRHIVGTKGYMAPEYLENGFVSPKLDVYAFGVLMLELLTGKEVAVSYDGVSVHLPEILAPVLHEEDGKENLRDFMDPSLQGNYPADLAIFIARLVDSCIQKDPSGRPGMDEVARYLSRIMTTSLTWNLSNSISGF